MLCARVVRGISSTENDVTPRSAMSRMVSIDPSGRRKPIEHLVAAQEGKVFLAGPVVRAVTEHLDDDVRGLEDLARAREDLGAPGRVFGIGIAGLRAGSRLDDDLEACLQKARNHRGHQSHAPLARVALSRDSDDHESTPSGWVSAPLGRDGIPPVTPPAPRIRVRSSARTPRRARG